jgi:hypothetical protein
MVNFSSVRTWQAGNWLAGSRLKAIPNFSPMFGIFLDAKPLDLGLVKKNKDIKKRAVQAVSTYHIRLAWVVSH